MITSDFELVSSWLAERLDCEIPREGKALGWMRDSDIVVGIMYEHYTRRSVTVSLAAEPGAVWPREFLYALFDYAFNTMGVAKMIACIEGVNYKSVSLVERLGFVLEASVSDVFPSGEMLIYTCTPEQCRWLEKENG